jgi:tRNA A-37 threonylcarbamoyl transferase component Bud32
VTPDKPALTAATAACDDAAMEAASLEPGQIIDREYKVERLLSQGGMGAVYVVEHITTGKRRALKVMLAHLVRDQASRDRFEREARIGARIESDNVVDVVDAGVDEATSLPFLVMELLDGVDLDHVIETHKTVPPAGVADIVGQLCDALGRAHAIGVVHSDLKPENVFLEKPRRRGVAFTVKVMDFGIAKLLSDEVREARVTTPMGSPLWMAPEQTQRGAAITPATDVWALGLIVYRMLTGLSFWRAANLPDGKVSVGTMVLEVVVQPLDPASVRAREMGVAPLLPPGFDAWFARCVVREQDQRFANASVAWDALEPILRGAPAAAAPAPHVATQVVAAPQVFAAPHVPTQAAPLPGAWGGPVVPTGPQAWSQPVAPPVAWSQPVAPQEARWPMVQQRVYASVQGGAYQMATVLDVNKQAAMIRIRLDGGGEGWVPAAHLRATY